MMTMAEPLLALAAQEIEVGFSYAFSLSPKP